MECGSRQYKKKSAARFGSAIRSIGEIGQSRRCFSYWRGSSILEEGVKKDRVRDLVHWKGARRDRNMSNEVV